MPKMSGNSGVNFHRRLEKSRRITQGLPRPCDVRQHVSPREIEGEIQQYLADQYEMQCLTEVEASRRIAMLDQIKAWEKEEALKMAREIESAWNQRQREHDEKLGIFHLCGEIANIGNTGVSPDRKNGRFQAWQRGRVRDLAAWVKIHSNGVIIFNRIFWRDLKTTFSSLTKVNIH